METLLPMWMRLKNGGMILREFLRKRWHAVFGGVKRWLLTKASLQATNAVGITQGIEQLVTLMLARKTKGAELLQCQLVTQEAEDIHHQSPKTLFLVKHQYFIHKKMNIRPTFSCYVHTVLRKYPLWYMHHFLNLVYFVFTYLFRVRLFEDAYCLFWRCLLLFSACHTEPSSLQLFHRLCTFEYLQSLKRWRYRHWLSFPCTFKLLCRESVSSFPEGETYHPALP